MDGYKYIYIIGGWLDGFHIHNYSLYIINYYNT